MGYFGNPGPEANIPTEVVPAVSQPKTPEMPFPGQPLPPLERPIRSQLRMPMPYITEGPRRRGQQGNGAPRKGGRVMPTLGALLIAVIIGGTGYYEWKHHKPAPAPSVEATATVTVASVTPTGPSWPAYGQFGAATGVKLAPSQPTTAYRWTDATLTALSYTMDAGATWAKVALPSTATTDQRVTSDFFINPLNPQMIYITIPVKSGTCIQGSAWQPFSPQAQAAPQPSSIPCAAQFVSTNHGATWQRVTLPMVGLLGGAKTDTAAEQPLRVQGSRLYAMLNPAPVNPTTLKSHLITSTDGLTWHLADSSLPTTVGIVNVAANPAGASLYAITNASDTFIPSSGPAKPNDYKLWHSTTAGAQWTLVGAWSLADSLALKAATQPYGSTLELFASPALVNTASAHPLRLSADGGKSWTDAPKDGLATGMAFGSGDALWGILPDGSALVSFSSDGTASPRTISLYSWKPGATSWKQVGPSLTNVGKLHGVIIQAPQPGQGTTIIVSYDTSFGSYQLPA